MDKFKKIIILLLFTFLSGCTVEYNLNIYNESYNMQTVISFDKSSELGTILFENAIGQNYLALPSAEYTFEDKSFENTALLNFGFNYSISTYRGSEAFGMCFEKKAIHEDDNFVYIIANSFNLDCESFLYMKPDSIVINVSSNHKVYEHNADRVNGNIYTWELNADNLNNIKFTYYKNEFIDESTSSKTSTIPKEVDNNDHIIIIIAIGFLVFILSLLIFIKIKRQK